MRFTLTLVCLVLSALGSAAANAGPTLLFEADTGKVLYSENIDDQWHPASLTKVMTAYIAFQDLRDGKIKIDTKIICTPLAH